MAKKKNDGFIDLKLGKDGLIPKDAIDTSNFYNYVPKEEYRDNVNSFQETLVNSPKSQDAIQIKCYAQIFSDDYKKFSTIYKFSSNEQCLAAFYVEDMFMDVDSEYFERRNNVATLYRNLINYDNDSSKYEPDNDLYSNPSNRQYDARDVSDYAIVFHDRFEEFRKKQKLEQEPRTLAVAKFFAQESGMLTGTPVENFRSNLQRAYSYRAQIRLSANGSQTFEDLYSIYFKDDFEFFKRTFHLENRPHNLAVSEFFSFQQRNYEKIHAGNIQKVQELVDIINDEHHIARTYSFFFNKEFEKFKEQNNLKKAENIIAIAKFYNSQENLPEFKQNIDKIKFYQKILDNNKASETEKIPEVELANQYSNYFNQEFTTHTTSLGIKNPNVALASFYVSEMYQSEYPFKLQKVRFQQNILTHPDSDEAKTLKIYSNFYKEDFEKFKKDNHLENVDESIALTEFYSHESGFPHPTPESISNFESRLTRARIDNDIVIENEVGSSRNLVSKEGEVSYLYLPRTPGANPNYLRVIQKSGKVFINMKGIDTRFSDQTKTVRIIGVDSHNTTEGNFLALDIIDNNGSKRKIALPINVDKMPSIKNDLERLVNNDIIQLNSIEPFERPNVENFNYSTDFELAPQNIVREVINRDVTNPNEEENVEETGAVTNEEQTLNTRLGVHKGKQSFEYFILNGLPLNENVGLSQEVILNESFGLDTPQKMTVIHGDSKTNGEILSVISRRNEKGDNIVQSYIYEVDGNKKICLSKSYVKSFIDNGITMDFGSPNANGFYEFDVNKIQITQDGKTQYGIKIAGSEIGLFVNGVGTEVIANGQHKVIMAQGKPNDISYSDKLIEKLFIPNSGITFNMGKEDENLTQASPKNLPIYLQQMMIANIALKRELSDLENLDTGLFSPAVSIAHGQEDGVNIKLFSFKMKTNNSKYQDMNFMTRTNSSGKTEIYAYAKVGKAQPKFVRVRSIRLGVEGIATEQKNPRLIMEVESGSDGIKTIITQLDNFSYANECLKEMYKNLEPAFAKPETSTERKVSQTAYWNLIENNLQSKKSDNSILVSENTATNSVRNADFATIAQMELNPVIERVETNEENAEISSTSHTVPDRPTHEQPVSEHFEESEQIQDPKVVKPPKEEKITEWKPHPAMPELRNGLIGFGVISMLLSIVAPFLSFLCLPLFLSALMVEIQPWNALGQAKQKRLQAELEKIQEREKVLEHQLEDINTLIYKDTANLRDIEKEIKEKYTDKGLPVPNKLQKKRQEAQKKLFIQQQKAQKIILEAKKKEVEQLHTRTNAAIEQENKEYINKERNAANAIQLATQKDIELNPELATERSRIENLETRPFGSLSPEEQAELEELRRKFKFRSQASKTYEDTVYDHKQHIDITTKNMEQLSAESTNIQNEIDNIDSKISHPSTIQSAEYNNITAKFDYINLPKPSEVPGIKTTAQDSVEDANYRNKNQLTGRTSGRQSNTGRSL